MSIDLSTTTSAREVEASIGQRLLWLLEHYRGRGGALNVPMVWRIRGALEVDALSLGLDGLVARHETLRTTYRSKGRRLLATIHPPARMALTVEDVSAGPDPEAAAIAGMRQEAATGIDPQTWPIRTRLWRVAADDHLFFLNIHHLASDASSNRLLSRDLTLLYDAELGRPVSLPPIGWQYADWASWQRGRLTGDQLGVLRDYWGGQLAGAEPVRLDANPITDAPDTSTPANQERFDVNSELVDGLREVAQHLRTTPFAVTLAVFYAHLHRASGQRDLSVASLFANRRRPEVAQTVGFFVNMLVLRVALDPAASFEALVRSTRAALLGALAHIDLPYQMLPPGTIPPPTDGQPRIDDFVFQFIDAFGDERTETGLKIDGVVLPLNQTRFALELVFVLNDDEECFINLRFDERRFDRAWARRFLADYLELAQALVQDPAAPLAARAAREILVDHDADGR